MGWDLFLRSCLPIFFSSVLGGAVGILENVSIRCGDDKDIHYNTTTIWVLVSFPTLHMNSHRAQRRTMQGRSHR